MRLRISFWPAALIGILVAKTFLSLAAKGSWVTAYSAVSYFVLLLLATSFAIRNGVQNTLGSRPFWVFLAIADGLWALDQWLYLYYGLGLHIDVPDNSIADPVLFLHIVPLMAAVATLPHRNVSERKVYPATLNFLLLLFFWSFLYGYTVVPYQYLFPNATSYALRFDILYLLENLALVLAVVLLILRARGAWKSTYLNLLGASVLYLLSSTVANIAIDSGGYVNGKLYGLGLTASVCWFVWLPLRARQLTGTDVNAARSDGSQDSPASVWAMIAVVMIAFPIVWQLFQRNENPGMQTFRLLVTIATMVCLASAAFVEEYLANRELASRVGLAHDRLRLVMESGKSVGWDWDVKSGRDTWFGDLKTMFGIASDTYDGHVDDFLRRVHPDDRGQVWKAVNDAMQSRQPYAAECRILWPDGTVRWIATKGKFYYATDGEPERMLGMAVDITERKGTEEALQRSEAEAKVRAEELAVILDAVPGMALIARDPSGDTITGSRVAYELLRLPYGANVSKSAPEGERPSNFRIFRDGQELPPSELPVQKAAITGQEVRESQTTLLFDDGTSRDMLGNAAPFLDNQGRVRGAVGVFVDITERNRAEAARRESEDRYRDLVEHSQDLLCTHDLEGKLLSANPAPARILGYEVAELLQIPMREVIAPEYREQFDAYLGRMKTVGKDQGLMAVLTRTGERRIWEYNNTLRTEGVPFPTVRGMAHDITEGMRAEKSLRLFRMLLDQSNDAIYVIDPETLRFIDVNGRACHYWGYTRNELLSMSVYDIDSKVEDFARINEELRNSGSVIFETAHRRKDGSTFSVEVSIKQVYLDRSYSVAVARDITERKQAETALRRSEENYRNFVAQSSEGIFRQDLDAPVPVDLPEDELVYHILHDSYLAECNHAMAKMYGLTSQQEFVGKRLTDTLDPNDPQNIELTRDYIRSGFRVLERESHEVDVLGNPKVFLNSMIGIVENGKLVRTWGIQRDVTERVRLEEARKQAEAALQESQSALARVARIATMGELTASIAHEINQPLAAVATNASASLHWLNVDPPNLAEARQAMANAMQEANRASGVIERIRTLLKKASPELRPLDVNEVIRDVLALADKELITGGVAVRTELAADAPCVLGDRIQLQQVMLNLILNAIDAMIMIKDRPRTLLIKSAKDAEGVLVEVQDSGKGLDPEQAPHIFDSFFTTKPDGIGMGLSISRSIVEAHGGHLSATSGSSQGAVFQMILPKAA